MNTFQLIIDIHCIYFGQALDLLRVSLTNNKDALTKSLFSQFWICQRCIPCLGVLGSRQQGKTEIKKEKKEIKKEEKVISVKKRNDEGERDKKEVK